MEQLKKMSLNEMKSLSRNEMKEILAGSGDYICDIECVNGNDYQVVNGNCILGQGLCSGSGGLLACHC